MKELEFENNENENQTNEISIQEIVEHLLSSKSLYSEEVTKLFTSKKQRDIQIVHEIMKTFNFEQLTVIEAFRIFTNRILLCGDSKQLIMITEHFSSRYSQCNPQPYCFEKTEKIITLILFLNTSLHSNNGKNAVDLKTFQSFFEDEPKKYTFDQDFITDLYKSIKNEEIKAISRNNNNNRQNNNKRLSSPTNYRQGDGTKKIKNEESVTHHRRHFRSGFLSRKILRSKSGKIFEKTIIWKKFYVSLDDLSLSLYKEEEAKHYLNSNIISAEENLQFLISNCNPVEVIDIHHSFAQVMSDQSNNNSKMFILHLIDESKYCFKAHDIDSAERWRSVFNYCAGLLSRPNYVTMNVEQLSHGKVYFHNGFTKYNKEDQIQSHYKQREELIKQLEYIENHMNKDSNYKSKIKFVNKQIERYRTYILHLEITNDADIPSQSTFDSRSSCSSTCFYNNSETSSMTSSSLQNSSSQFKFPLMVDTLSNKPQIGFQLERQPFK